MSLLLRSYIKFEGFFFRRHFDKLTRTPKSSQKKYIMRVIKNNRDTLYGKEHGFPSITSIRNYRNHVPINQYNDLEPYVSRMANGEQNVLTADSIFMFNLTSGTTDKPKYIPVTPSTKRSTLGLNHHWFYRALLDHPDFLSKGNLTITGSAIEGYTSASIPYGSMSGLIYKNLARPVRSCFVLPFIVSEIRNYSLRYYVMSRLALGKDISFIATPNPTTLLKLAEVGIKHQQEIIRSIHDGKLLNNMETEINPEDLEAINAIEATLKANPARAAFLESILNENGTLTPRHCWPSLKLIACWLGGSVGYQADKLSQLYGNVPKRDLGYLASEGNFTVPFEDNTPAGILALQNNFYEFIPEESASHNHPQILLCHELEVGKNYNVLLTNESGLYRYDMNDTVRVEKFYNQTPVLAFIRKTKDVLNITGEKVHLNQLIMAFQKIEKKSKIEIRQFRVVSNLKHIRYDIYLELAQDVDKEKLKNSILPNIDSFLAEFNIEYAQKRKSKRLNAPWLHIMKSSWAEDVKKQLIESGRRDIQYKWQSIASDFLEIDRGYVKYTIHYEE